MSGEPAHRFLFFSAELGLSSVQVELGGDEHGHLSRVLRMSEGEMVYVTDGRGLIARCRIEEVGRTVSRLSVEAVEDERAMVRRVTLALALLKKDAFGRAVEQCTELGITSCLPFLSERSHVKHYSPAFMERLRRIALSAAKQSFRSVVPEIEPVAPFEDLVLRVGPPLVALVGDADAEPLRPFPPGGALTIIVGPEGGLTDGERRLLEAHGARAVSISPYRLRSETAAASLVAVALTGTLSREGPSPCLD